MLFIFCLIYKISLENKKSLPFKRFYLLISLVLAMVLPVVKFQFFVNENKVVQTKNFVVDQLSTIPVNIVNKTNESISVFLIAYLIVCSLFLIRFCINLRKIYRIKQLGKINLTKYGKIISSSKVHSPFSFNNYIYVNTHDWDYNLINNAILLHEQAHVKQKHTIDILFIEVLKIFSWFQPFLFYYKKLIQENHEYLADEFSLKQTTDVKQYQNLILNYYNNSTVLVPLSSAIHFKNLKKRFIMMKNKTKAKVWIPVLSVSVLTIGFITITGIESKAAEIKQIENKVTDVIETTFKQPEISTLNHKKSTESRQATIQEIPVFKFIKGKDHGGYFYNYDNNTTCYYFVNAKKEVLIYNKDGVLQDTKRFKFRLEEIKEEQAAENQNAELKTVLDNSPKNNDPDAVHSFVEKKARPKEGLKVMYNNFINEFNTKNWVINDSIVSTRLKFIVEKDGSFSNITAVNATNKEVSAEAIRVLKTMPNWNPAENKGEVVRSSFTMPIKIKLK